MARMKLVASGLAVLILGLAATSLQAAPATGIADGLRSAASTTGVTKTTFNLLDHRKKRAHHHKHRKFKKHHRKHRKHRH